MSLSLRFIAYFYFLFLSFAACASGFSSKSPSDSSLTVVRTSVSETSSRIENIPFSWLSLPDVVNEYHLVKQKEDGNWPKSSKFTGYSYQFKGLSQGHWGFKTRPSHRAGCGGFSSEKHQDGASPLPTPRNITVQSGELEKVQLVNPPIQAPRVVDAVSENPGSQGTVEVKWVPPGSGIKITGYEIEQCKDDCSTWSCVYSGVSTGPITLPREKGKRLTSGSYKFRIRALVRTDDSTTYSAWVSSPRVAVIRKGLINPKAVRFTQDSIKATFTDGRKVEDLIRDLKSGKLNAGDVPPIRVFSRDGKIYSLDNRRLKAFQEAAKPIRITPATPGEIVEGSFKFTSKNDGTSIRIRKGDI
ncbi:fibronectin type III domain-containing protein [Microbulbifer variabilis]|uniref:fibronectin type III domain-containing protein n=1 Tax=Microbulbifer variabilis TaxID=266805 RepID=UPI001CFDE35C|nr:fibronectin type III domain-containing protein [Microbulbifer variabilis]